MKQHRFAFVLLALIATLLFVDSLVKREVFMLRDHFDYFQPLRWFTAVELKAGRLPLWNPWSASGEPWLANPQTGVFYPPSWLFLALPFPTAYQLFLLFHLTALGWGAYLLFTRAVSQGAALVGATALMVSGPIVSLLDVSNNLATLSWIPFAFWCALGGRWKLGGLTLALAFLGGEPFFAAAGAAMYVVIVMLQRERALRDRISSVLFTGFVALGLSAIQLFPFLTLLRGSERTAGMDAAEVLRHSMPARDWLRIAIPPALDEPIQSPHLGQNFIPVIYVGVLVAALAIAGIVATIAKRRDTLAWVALLGTAAFFASGPDFLTRLPLTLFRYPARLLPLAAVAIAALAAIGWNRFRRDRRWLDLVVVLLIVVDLTPRIRPLLRSASFDPNPVPYGSEVGARSKVMRLGEIEPARRAEWMAGYLNLYDRRFDAFTAAPVISDAYLRRYRETLASSSPASLASLGAGFLITGERTGRGRAPLHSVFQEIERTAGGVSVWRNREALPMAAHFAPSPLEIRNTRWRVDTSSARVMVEAERDGILVLRQQNAPGWRVTVDGKPARALVVEGLFRAVDVPKGRHEVMWTYHSRALVAGAVVTSATLFAMMISFFVKRPRHDFQRKNFSSLQPDFE